jgi:hypothetical protein
MKLREHNVSAGVITPQGVNGIDLMNHQYPLDLLHNSR